MIYAIMYEYEARNHEGNVNEKEDDDPGLMILF